MDMRYELSKRKEKIQLWIVWHLPKWVIYWAMIRLFSYVTTHKPGTLTGEIKILDALKVWEEQ